MKLIFISDKIQAPKYREDALLPFEFISFGIIRGKMYKYRGKKNTITLQEGVDRIICNKVIYGSIYAMQDEFYYQKILDNHMGCSKGKLKNSIYDTNHRLETKVIPIFFNSIDELDRLLYREGKPQTIEAYYGNVKHPHVKKHIREYSKTRQVYRIVSGVNDALLLQYKKIKGDV